MRKKILHAGVEKLSYEIREIVKLAHEVEQHGLTIYWENIGDPVQKGAKIPNWMKSIIKNLVENDKSYAYSPTKGELKTRQYLANKVNHLGGAQIGVEDILFCNGLGDAISKLYEFLDPKVRIIGPSPAYSTHSSTEAMHANSMPITYELNPYNSWLPDISKLKKQLQENPNIVGILIINPNNPTGMVYPTSILKEIVALAKEFDLFLIADEIYANITYNQASTSQLSQIIGNVCGISMKGISKEFPWPGSRCGWMEFYNVNQDAEFQYFTQILENAKMLEVCSTTLPQKSIPEIMEHPKFQEYRKQQNQLIAQQGDTLIHYLQDIPQIVINQTQGAFYNTIIFKEGVLNANQSLFIESPKLKKIIEQNIKNISLDKQFVYYLLASTGICVVPISSFCSNLLGFRMTLLEQNQITQKHIYSTLKNSILAYINS